MDKGEEGHVKIDEAVVKKVIRAVNAGLIDGTGEGLGNMCVE